MNTLTLYGVPDTMVTILSNEFLDSYMPKASGDFVKIYLYFLRHCSCPEVCVSLASAADTFCMTESDILRALKYWEREGLMALAFASGQLMGVRLLPLPGIKPPAPTATSTTSPTTATTAAPTDAPTAEAIAAPVGADINEQKQALPDPLPGINMYNGTPAYTARQMEQFKKNNDDQLFFVIEQYLGKPLGPTDVNKIVYFSENLGFSSDLIEYLFEYCVSNNHYSIHYIEKTALAWAKDGIDTVAKARTRCTYYNKTSFDILKAFGISNRNPAPTEMEHIRRWTREYGLPMPIILEACRRTIEATHNPSFVYADKILKDWYDNKVGSMDDVKKLDEAHEQRKRASGNFVKKDSAPPQPAKKGNKFHNFEQRSYDYGKLEQALFKKSLNKTDGGH